MEYEYEVWIDNGYRYTLVQNCLRHKFDLDGYDEATKTAYEFYGDHWREHPQVFGETYQDKYDQPMARNAILESHGIDIMEVWKMTRTQEPKY